MLRTRTRSIVQLAVLAALAQTAVAADPAATQPADMPVKAVTLFSSGVGYFEHFGTVNGDGSTELRFKTDQINDILKSLVLQDLDGGQVSAVQYASADPVDKTLKSFQVDLTANPPMADLLNQLRGAKVTLDVGGEQVNGTILGVEKRSIPQTPPAPAVDTWVINLIEGAQLKSFDLSKLAGVKLADPQLASDFARALATLAAARDQDKKPVSIHFTGKGERRIRLGYVVESPVWKTSYRLVLGDKEAKMQGWAIVENQTDNDWKNVQLSLVSGRPISFEMELYQPIYLERPTVVLNLFKNLRPQMYAGGMNENAGPVRRSMERQTQSLQKSEADKSSAFGGGASFDLAAAAPTAAPAPMDMTSSVQPLASGMKLGELFHFTVGDVTLPRQSSAMIPIVGDSIGCERVSIYNSGVMPRNALSGVMLENTTGKHLLQGPVTVYTDGGYAGDATIDNLPPGQKRMLSYGVDLELLIDPKSQAENTLITGKIAKGVLLASRKYVQTVKYAVESKSDHDKTLIIEQPIIQTWSLTDSPDPMEKTDQLYRFKLPVPKGGHTALTVSQQSVQDQQIALLDTNEDVLLYWSRQGEFPDKVRDALIEAAKRKQAVTDLESQINQKKQELDAISTEQARLRENMRTVDKTSQYYNRLMTKLNDQETKIEKLQSDRDDLEGKANLARIAFQNYLSDLNVQ